MFRSEIERIRRASSYSILRKFIDQPLRYFTIQFRNKVLYAMFGSTFLVERKTFFGEKMCLRLPSNTDIVLFGGKTHSSELKLADFLSSKLRPGDVFVDVGSHVGYFSLLASVLVGDQGHVFAFEPTQDSFQLLKRNSSSKPNISIFNQAISTEAKSIRFYEFPNKYSEYNTTDISQFEGESWFRENKPEKVDVQACRLDSFDFIPTVIKIDVEGAELEVIESCERIFSKSKPDIVMEFLSDARGNTSHRKADKLLIDYGYQRFYINDEYALVHLPKLEVIISNPEFDSDNFYYRYPTSV